MKHRKSILCLIFLMAVHLPFSGFAAGLLVIDSQKTDPYSTLRMAMMKRLSEMGYQTGRNLNVKYWSIGNAEGRALRAWLREKETPYDVIFLNGTVATKMFKQFAYNDNRYRFVFGAVTDPVDLGVINGFDKFPDANFTGMCHPVRVEQRLMFIRECMPEAKDIGLIYADMPQSHSYLAWIRQALKKKEFSSLRFHLRKVQLVSSENGHLRMTRLAEKHVKELNGKVDLFLSSNDQLGSQKSFAEMVWQTSSKPLIGLSRKDVMQGWGAAMAVYPDMEKSGERIAEMIVRLFQGGSINEIRPEWPKSSYAFDLKKLGHFGITIPEELLSAAGNNVK